MNFIPDYRLEPDLIFPSLKKVLAARINPPRRVFLFSKEKNIILSLFLVILKLTGDLCLYTPLAQVIQLEGQRYVGLSNSVLIGGIARLLGFLDEVKIYVFGNLQSLNESPAKISAFVTFFVCFILYPHGHALMVG